MAKIVTWDGASKVIRDAQDGELPPEPTADELLAAEIQSMRTAVDAHVETVAKSRDYNSAAHLAGYAKSTVAPWKAEAEAFILWRDNVWLFVFNRLAEAQAGNMAPPESPEALLIELPSIAWPP